MSTWPQMFSAVFCWSVTFASWASADVILSAEEIRQTLRHGPWSPAPGLDPSNRVSGNPDAIELGRALFSDPVLSADQTLSCATCHDPARDFTDGVSRATGRELLNRNTQPLWNLSQHRWFGWAGDTDNLWAQSLTPILNPLEMAHDPVSLQSAIRQSPHREAYERLFQSIEREDPTNTAVNLSKILAAYLETLTTGKTSFDHFRDALAEGDVAAVAHYPEDAQRGLQIFLGHGRCAFCHSGPHFSNGEFHDAGVPYFQGAGEVDPGRHGGLQALFHSPFTLDGDHSDDPDRSGAWAVRNVRQQHGDFGIFRVPSLRRAVHTGPYMHDGSLPSLRAVLDHYNMIDIERLHADGEAILRPLRLEDGQLRDLQAFLETLSDDPAQRP